MAAEFIYMTNPAKIAPFLHKIRAAGKPEKVTLKTIESLGFKSINDRPLLSIIKALGLVDGSGCTDCTVECLSQQPQGGTCCRNKGTLRENADATPFEQFFKAMRQHLLNEK